MSSPASLRIGLVADPYLPVPPRLYGGIERILDFLVEGLVERGHTVTLWGHPESDVPCELVPYGVPPHGSRWARGRELGQVASGLWRRRDELDLVHSFGRLAGMLPLFPLAIPKIQSYQREITPPNIERAVRLAGDSLSFTACSTNCRREVSHVGRWETVYNGVRMRDYIFRSEVADDAPLVFLGRIDPTKGTHTAIQIAKGTGRHLVIAGNVPDTPKHQQYFETEIAPHLNEQNIRYVGPVDDVQKNKLLGTAAAFLMPIEWEEPFGIVMAEALACGTPVVGFRRGSVPEVVEHGVSGFVVDTTDEMVAAIQRVPELNRRASREHCERMFSARVIVDAYESLYRRRLDKRVA